MADLVEVYKDEGGEWRWHRKAENNEVVSTSGEGYINRYYAVDVAERLNPGCEFKVEGEAGGVT